MVRTGFFSRRKFWTPRSLRALVRGGSLNFLLNFHPIFKHFLFSAISHSITPKTMFSFKSAGGREAVGSEIFLSGKIVSPLEIHCKKCRDLSDSLDFNVHRYSRSFSQECLSKGKGFICGWNHISAKAVAWPTKEAGVRSARAPLTNPTLKKLSFEENKLKDRPPLQNGVTADLPWHYFLLAFIHLCIFIKLNTKFF